MVVVVVVAVEQEEPEQISKFVSSFFSMFRKGLGIVVSGSLFGGLDSTGLGRSSGSS